MMFWNVSLRFNPRKLLMKTITLFINVIAVASHPVTSLGHTREDSRNKCLRDSLSRMFSIKDFSVFVVMMSQARFPCMDKL